MSLVKSDSHLRRAFLSTVIIAALAQASEASAQAQATSPDQPGHFAIQGARVVTVSGGTIDNGTVVVRNGVITDVGRNVDVPADAWVIDGSGLTVYPGFIDALTDIGHPGGSPPRGGGSGGRETRYSWGPEDRPATTPWVNAADDLDGSDERIERWRSAGFTTVIASPSEGIFPGQSAVINLAGERPGDMVVKTRVALRVNLSRGGSVRGFPGSLMGVFAYLKQVFLDAAHYDAAWSLYEDDPRGLERPEYDRALEPIRAAVRGGTPFLVPATTTAQAQRAIDLAAESGTTPVIYGLHRGYEAADVLAANRVTALVNVDWPRPPRDGDPEAQPSLNQLRLWDRAPTTAAALNTAGVRFAFYSGDISDPADVVENVGEAVERGLSTEAAIRALTLTPAEIFGVADRLGSIEDGKIANLVVTDGDLFVDDTELKMVFVDGKQFEVGELASPDDDEDEEEEEEETTTTNVEVPMARDRGAYRSDPVTLLRNATILTASNGRIENGDILIRDGKIAEVGQGLDAPRGAHVVDASGKYVIPGIFDAHSHIAGEGGINEGTVAVSAMVGIEDVIDPDQNSIYRALAGGVTSANVLHGSANPIGGKNAVLKLRWGADAEGLKFAGAIPGIKFALGENTKRDRDPDRYPSTRMGVNDVIRQAFVEAQQYMADWEEYEAAGEGNAIPPRRDLKLETLAEILRGERLVHAHSYRADEIVQLLRLAEEFGFRIATFQHVLEGYKVAKEIAEHGAGASTFSDWWGYKVEAYDAIPYNAALMTEKGVLVSINSDSREEMRHLNQEAAKAMKWGGLSEEEALRLVTLNPAMQLRVDDRTGSIDVGKDADLVVYDGHPLSVYGVVQQTYVDGELYFDIDLDKERQQQIEAEIEALRDKLGIGARESGRPITEDGQGGREETR